MLQREEAAQITRYLSILGVCRQIYYEARLLPFERHTFEFRMHKRGVFLGPQKLDVAKFKEGVKSMRRLKKVSIHFCTSRLSILSMHNWCRIRVDLKDVAQRLGEGVREAVGQVVEWEVQRAAWETQPDQSWPHPRHMRTGDGKPTESAGKK